MEAKSILKKLAALVLSLCTAGTMLAGIIFPAAAVSSGTTGRCRWVLIGTVLTISGSGPMADYTLYPGAPWGTDITSVIIEDGVTSIGEYSFYDCKNLTGVSIPDSVTRIGGYSFFDCERLESVVIPDSVKTIGGYAFCDCNSMTSLTIPNSVTSIGEDAFYNCTGLTSVTIPDSVKSIGKFAFSNCSRLANITIGSGVEDIYDYAFRYCTALKSITIPGNVSRMGDGVFYGCSALKSIEIPDSVKRIGAGAFYGCSALTSATIGNGVRSIAFQMFIKCSKLKSVQIGSGVVSISGFAFKDCTSLESITIPDKVITISSGAFSGCTALKSVRIPDRVSGIGDSVFSGCKNLATVSIGNRVKSLGDFMFSECDALVSVTIPNSVTSIGDSTFYGCDSLKSVTIGKNVSSLGKYTFGYCESLGNIAIPKSLTSIGKWAFVGCSSLKENGKVYYCGTDSQWENISIDSENSSLQDAARENHRYEWVTDKEPTCAQTGIKHEQCVICGATRSMNTVIPATRKHTYKSVTKEGYTVHTCKVCGDSYKDNFAEGQDGVKNMYVEQSGTELVVNWDAYPYAQKYIIYVTDANGNHVVTKIVDGYKTSVALSCPSDIEGNKPYTVGVRVKTTKWLGTAYRDETLKLNRNEIPTLSTPTFTTHAIADSSLKSTEVALSWDTIKGADKYVVYFTSADGKTVVKETRSTEVRVSGLSPKTAYNVKIQARILDGGKACYSAISKTLTTVTTAA